MDHICQILPNSESIPGNARIAESLSFLLFNFQNNCLFVQVSINENLIFSQVNNVS